MPLQWEEALGLNTSRCGIPLPDSASAFEVIRECFTLGQVQVEHKKWGVWFLDESTFIFKMWAFYSLMNWGRPHSSVEVFHLTEAISDRDHPLCRAFFVLPCWDDDTYGEDRSDRLEVQDADRNAVVILPWRSFMWPEFQCTDWMLQISGLWALILNVPWPSWISPKILQWFMWHNADDHKTRRLDDAPSMKSICAKCNNLTATSWEDNGNICDVKWYKKCYTLHGNHKIRHCLWWSVIGTTSKLFQAR